MRVVFMGTPDFVVPLLEELAQGPDEIIAVYTRPDRAAGRGRHPELPPVKRWAQAHHVPVFQPESIKDTATITELARLEPTVIVVAAYGHILPPEVLSLPTVGCLNVHPSLLPRHRGPSPVASALLAGDAVAGVSIMLVTMDLDGGPVLAQRKIVIAPDDTAGSLTTKLMSIGAALLTEALAGWVSGQIRPWAQDNARATYSKLHIRGDGEVRWQLSAEEIERMVRAYSPWPGSYTWWRGKRLKICQARLASGNLHGQPGQVVALPQPFAAGVVTGKGTLMLCRVQSAGKRELPIDEFVRGQSDFVGSLLG